MSLIETRGWLSEKQSLVVMAIADARRTRGYAPTVREIVAAAELSSTSVAWHHLALLRDAGLVEWEWRLGRTLRLTAEAKSRLRWDEARQLFALEAAA